MDIKNRIFGADRPSYHHGRLKEALIDAARELVAERGPSGFTLAEAAKRVGVTGAAPYRHFADREALLRELALRGFAVFNERQQAAWQGGQPDASTAFRRLGRSYAAFAAAEPGLYAAMFGSEEGKGGDVTTLAEAAFNQLLGATAAVLAQYGVPGGGTAELAAQIWALSHGFAMLKFNGFVVPSRQGLDPGAMNERAVTALFESAIRRAKGG